MHGMQQHGYNNSQRAWKKNLQQKYGENIICPNVSLRCCKSTENLEKCSKQFNIEEEQLRPNQTTDRNAMSRLSLALFRAFKTSLMVRNIDGHFSMINDQDQWEIANTSTVKFAPSLVIAPSRTVRILGQHSKSDEPPAAKLEIVMGVPEEFLYLSSGIVRIIKEIHGFQSWLTLYFANQFTLIWLGKKEYVQLWD